MYSEGNDYSPIQEWALYERGLGEGPWQVVKVTTDRAEMEAWVAQNSDLGWQKYAQAQHTVSA